MHLPTTYGDSFADVYDAWYGDLSDPGAMVSVLQSHLGGCHLLELGVGTGRLAVPLSDAGFVVVGLDASVAMLSQMKTKDTPGDTDPIAAVGGDMAALPFAADSFDGALIAYNTFFNLTTELDQRRCFIDVARVLRKGATVAIEAFVPTAPPDETEQHMTQAAEPGVFIATRQRGGSPVVDGAHITFDEEGVRTRPWRIRTSPPEELDAMAAEAGLALAHRMTNWQGETYDPSSGTHVSLYRCLS